MPSLQIYGRYKDSVESVTIIKVIPTPTRPYFLVPLPKHSYMRLWGPPYSNHQKDILRNILLRAKSSAPVREEDKTIFEKGFYSPATQPPNIKKMSD